ncbi:hypothetical protein KOY48_02480 [Candidatus Minimicrobia naudis]|uniref:DNA polymerase III subunit delta n=1 Tax=Candidatus Minimicrobia naudis TaxID=2841263 RepID=A0A8F1MC55_9BACT|nr:hypothetical protein KOY48_02480 [Candidatus Minimicrobia naudis]
MDEVLGQDHVTSILRRALEQGKFAHAYLLTGPRGVGKTIGGANFGARD